VRCDGPPTGFTAYDAPNDSQNLHPPRDADSGMMLFLVPG
jgi:hypothetical protein